MTIKQIPIWVRGFLLLVMSVSSSGASAEPFTAEINGHVLTTASFNPDLDLQPVSEVDVYAINTETAQELYIATTDSNGYFQASLPTGKTYRSYFLRFEHKESAFVPNLYSQFPETQTSTVSDAIAVIVHPGDVKNLDSPASSGSGSGIEKPAAVTVFANSIRVTGGVRTANDEPTDSLSGIEVRFIDSFSGDLLATAITDGNGQFDHNVSKRGPEFRFVIQIIDPLNRYLSKFTGIPPLASTVPDVFRAQRYNYSAGQTFLSLGGGVINPMGEPLHILKRSYGYFVGVLFGDGSTGPQIPLVGMQVEIINSRAGEVVTSGFSTVAGTLFDEAGRAIAFYPDGAFNLRVPVGDAYAVRLSDPNGVYETNLLNGALGVEITPNIKNATLYDVDSEAWTGPNGGPGSAVDYIGQSVEMTLRDNALPAPGTHLAQGWVDTESTTFTGPVAVPNIAVTFFDYTTAEIAGEAQTDQDGFFSHELDNGSYLVKFSDPTQQYATVYGDLPNGMHNAHSWREAGISETVFTFHRELVFTGMKLGPIVHAEHISFSASTTGSGPQENIAIDVIDIETMEIIATSETGPDGRSEVDVAAGKSVLVRASDTNRQGPFFQQYNGAFDSLSGFDFSKPDPITTFQRNSNIQPAADIFYDLKRPAGGVRGVVEVEIHGTTGFVPKEGLSVGVIDLVGGKSIASGQTDAGGNFAIAVPNGSYALRASDPSHLGPYRAQIYENYAVTLDSIGPFSQIPIDDTFPVSGVQRFELLIDHPPIITAPLDLSIEATDTITPVLDLGMPILSDAEDRDPPDVSNDAPLDGFDLGVTTVTWTAIDQSLNTAEDVQLVSLVDTTPPSITPPANITVITHQSITPVTLTTPNVSDAVGIISLINDAPPSGFPLGTTVVTWTVTDAAGNSASTSHTVTVDFVNNLPVAVNDNAKAFEDGGVSIAVLANDTDADFDALTITSVGPAANGTVTPVSAGNLSYKPAANFNGLDDFSYTISDGFGGIATATVSVDVLPVNDNPTAKDDVVAAHEDTAATINVLANDFDIDGDFIRVVAVTPAHFGKAIVNADSTITYSPAANYSGNDTFDYRVADVNGGFASATVRVEVLAVNDPPVANDDFVTTQEDTDIVIPVLLNDEDADGDTLRVVLVGKATNGIAQLNPDGTVVFTPKPNFNGIASFLYSVTDGGKSIQSAIVTIEVTPVNDAPTANAGLDETVHVGTIVTLDGSQSSDVDGDSLTFSWSIFAKPIGSIATLSSPTTVNPGFATDNVGSYMFGLVVTDTGGLNSAVSHVQISTENTSPIADAGSDQEVQLINSIVTLDGSLSFDLEGDDLVSFSWSIIQQPLGSTATILDPTAITTTIIPEVKGDYVLQLVVTDFYGLDSSPDTITLSFSNLQPVADSGGNLAATVGDTVSLNGSGSSDPNGDLLSYRWNLVSVPFSSTAAIANGTAQIASIVPDTSGTYVISLIVNDGTIDSTSSNMTLVAVSVLDLASATLMEVQNVINSLPTVDLKNNNLKKTLTNKLNATLAKLEQGLYAEVLDKLINDLLTKTDGCVNGGAPDKNDWITDCTAQNQVYALIQEEIALVSQLLP